MSAEQTAYPPEPEQIEQVQRRFTKRLTELKMYSCCETSKLKGDMQRYITKFMKSGF